MTDKQPLDMTLKELLGVTNTMEPQGQLLLIGKNPDSTDAWFALIMTEAIGEGLMLARRELIQGIISPPTQGAVHQGIIAAKNYPEAVDRDLQRMGLDHTPRTIPKRVVDEPTEDADGEPTEEDDGETYLN